MRAHECWSGMVPGDVREEDCCGICGREADSLNHLSPEAAKVAGVDMICEDCTQRTFGYTEDPDEVAPCLICGEPKPNREACPTCQEAEKEAQA